MAIPKGKLIPIGGSEKRKLSAKEEEEDSPDRFEVLERVVAEMGGKSASIEIIPTASSIPKSVSADFVRTFEHIGCKKTGVLPNPKNGNPDQPEFLKRLKAADGIMFTGGNQVFLSQVFLASKFLEMLRDRYQSEEGFVIAGTSAGAMGMSEIMIAGGNPQEALINGNAQIEEGLAFIPSLIIDSHFAERGRQGRLSVAVARNPHLLGVGLSEDTGVVITQARYLECIGSGHVSIFDGEQSRCSPDNNQPIYVENLCMHLLTQGMRFDIQTKKILRS